MYTNVYTCCLFKPTSFQHALEILRHDPGVCVHDITMSDIFDNPILCKECNSVMKLVKVIKNGFSMRAVQCPKCGSIVLHPVDKSEYDNFINLRKKEFSVKMRLVGNSYAVSIPKEIVQFMNEQERIMNHMVKLCFEEANKISLFFNDSLNKNIKEKDDKEKHLNPNKKINNIRD